MERRPQGGAAKRQVLFLQLSCRPCVPLSHFVFSFPLMLWKEGHRVVQPRGKCSSCNCLAALCIAVMFCLLPFHFLLVLWPAYHYSFRAYCMSIPSAYCLWRLIMSRLYTLQQCISVGVRWKRFASVCKPAPLRKSRLAESSLRVTVAVVAVVITTTITKNHCILKITSSWTYNFCFFNFWSCPSTYACSTCSEW